MRSCVWLLQGFFRDTQQENMCTLIYIFKVKCAFGIHLHHGYGSNLLHVFQKLFNEEIRIQSEVFRNEKLVR